MPARYGRKYYKRRTNYKKKSNKKTFSRFNTYKNRSAKAQAYQIYKLNKRVSAIQKATKPETQVRYGDVYTAFNQTNSFSTLPNYSTTAKIFPIIPPRDFVNLQGRLARIKSIKVYGSFHSAYDLVYPAVLRLIFLQCKSMKIGIPLESELIAYTPNNNADFERGPLRTGITSNYRILKTKTIKLTQPQMRHKTFKISLKKVYNWRTEGTFSTINIESDFETQQFPKGEIFCLALFSNTGFKSNSQDQYAVLTLDDLKYKMVYFDQN